MKILVPGHLFDLASLDGDFQQRLQFVERMGTKYPGNLEARPGTTNQEVCRALISRMEYVDNQWPCLETKLSLIKAREIILLHEIRAKQQYRKFLPNLDISSIELFATCPVCGHILCEEHS